MNLHTLIFTENACYKAGKKITPKGIMVHSTAANNPWLNRYVGPDDGLLGKNKYNNHWNQPMDRGVCVHAFIGKLANGSIATYQTLPWNHRAWHCASGKNGSGNDTHISFEICEDSLNDVTYFNKVYQEAIDLCVYLCEMYNLTEKDIICHSEGYKQGIASNHSDVMHWFPKHGKSMDTFRAAVKKELCRITEDAAPATVTGAPSTGSADDEEKMWAYFMEKIGNAYGVAGLMGNIYAESGLKSNNLQNSYEDDLHHSDVTYTAAVDSGIYTDFINDGAGYGLSQWTHWSRKEALLNYALSKKKSIGDYQMQLDFLYKELSESFKGVMSDLKNAKSVLEASNSVLTKYERPADQGEKTQEKRVGYGQRYYNKYVDELCSSATRISGKDRSETAIEVADELKSKLGIEKFDAIIIASGEQFADALAGSYLAIKKDAPILLSCKYSVEMNEQYIQDNLADDGIIYILGGTAELAVPDEVEESLKLLGYRTKRLAGADRYETNLMILEEAGVTDEEILISTGWGFGDSLAASATGLPIMMINAGKNGEKTALTDAQVKFLTDHASNKVSIIGGTAVIGEGMEAAIDAIVTGELDRVSGENRQATSIAVARKYFEAPTTAFIAYAWNFPDGLCGGPLAHAYGAPLLLVDVGAEMHSAKYVSDNSIETGIVLGGTTVIPNKTANAVFCGK